jgi:hypothetical protein
MMPPVGEDGLNVLRLFVFVFKKSNAHRESPGKVAA